MTHVTTASGHDEALQALLSAFSIELTPGDDKSIDAASRLLPVGTETFIAGLRRVRVEQVVSAAVRLRQAGDDARAACGGEKFCDRIRAGFLSGATVHRS
jgi:hypothetical protein